MVIDSIKNLSVYRGIPVLNGVIDYIEANDIKALPEGRTDIDGDALYVMIQVYTTKDEKDTKPEAHDRYIDLQYVLEGEEYIGYADRSSFGPPAESRPENDIHFFEGKTGKLLLKSGSFGIYYPWDIHEPCIAPDGPGKVKKAVFKIRCEQ